MEGVLHHFLVLTVNFSSILFQTHTAVPPLKLNSISLSTISLPHNCFVKSHNHLLWSLSSKILWEMLWSFSSRQLNQLCGLQYFKWPNSFYTLTESILCWVGQNSQWDIESFLWRYNFWNYNSRVDYLKCVTQSAQLALFRIFYYRDTAVWVI